MKLVFTSFLCMTAAILCSCSTLHERANPPTKAEIVAALQSYEQQLKAMEADYRLIRRKSCEPDSRVTWAGTWHTDGKREKLVGLQWGKDKKSVIYDGTNSTVLVPAERGDHLFARILAGGDAVGNLWPPRLLYGHPPLPITGHTPVDYLSEMVAANPLAAPISITTLRGSRRVLVNLLCEPPDKEGSTHEVYDKKGRILRLWLAPERDYAPVEMEITCEDLPSWALRDIQHEHIDGVWVPISGARLSYAYDYSNCLHLVGFTDEQQAQEWWESASHEQRLTLYNTFKTVPAPSADILEYRIVVDRVKMGPVDEQLFAVHIPDGTRICDQVLEVTYTQGDVQEMARVFKHRRLLNSILDKPAPALNAKQWLHSAPLRLEDLRGKLVILNFFSKGCGPCRRDYRLSAQLHKDRAAYGLVVIGIHTPGSAQESLADLVKEFTLEYPIAIDLAPEAPGYWGKTFAAYKVDTIPCAILIDKVGTVVARGDLHGVSEKAAALLAQEKR